MTAERWSCALFLILVTLLVAGAGSQATADTIAGHTVRLDDQGKIVPWFSPAASAYDQFLHRRWDFIKTRVPLSPGPPPRSLYPQYYFYDGFVTTQPDITPDYWMNDVGEKIPNWFESARLYYAYTGDTAVMTIVRGLVDYAIDHGTSPAHFAWPGFPHTTTGPGDVEFEGFTPTFALHEVQVDHAGEMGLTYFRLYQFTGEPRYLASAIAVADVLAANARIGTATRSVWPYRVVLDTGTITAEHGANWTGAYALLASLVDAGLDATGVYAQAMTLARDFILQFPMQTGYWTDGHSDNPINSNTYKSNLSKSNAALYILDHPDFDPDGQSHLPALIQWTVDNFVTRTTGGEPATAYGADIVGEQDGFLYKMDYQTARHAAECARWYRASGDAAYLERAYRSLNWVTYCSDAEGRATESPYSLGIATWWSDEYGEAPRMFYQAFAAMPEWAPPGEDHILYSSGVLTGVAYRTGEVDYTARDATDTEYLRLSFVPATVTLDGSPLPLLGQLTGDGYTVRALGGGDHAVAVHHTRAGQVHIVADPATLPPTVSLTGPPDGATYPAPALISLTADATGNTNPITVVEFLSGGTKIGEDRLAPYGFRWLNVPPGAYRFTARVTDDVGRTKTSAPVTVTVTGASGAGVLGNTGEGIFTDTIWDNGAWINACRFQAAADMTVTEIYAKVTPITGRYQCAIYSDLGGEADRLLRATLEVTNATGGWQRFTLTAPLAVTGGGFYWLAIWSDAAEARVYATSGGTIRWGRYDYGPWPDPITLTGGGNTTYSIYATDGPLPPGVTVDGAQMGQTIDGFGINANHRSWNGGELRPVLDLLIDQAGMTLYRVVYDNTDWEATNDNADPAVMDWPYYDALYGSSAFTRLWDLTAYLNQRGITDGVFFNFMGPGPSWMGGGRLTAGMEEEWAESIASLVAYARQRRGLEFRLLAPDNEPDISNEGISMDVTRYTAALGALARQLDASGLGDLRLVGPDRAGGGTGYMPEMMADPAIMAKLAHFGVHSYSDGGGGSSGVLDYIRGSAYPDRSFWMTEFNVWCPTCDSGIRGTYDWAYCRGTADYLLDHLANGASGGIVWEGYDSFYAHPPSTWSFWGLIAVDDENAVPRTYTPRKNLYTVAQVSRFVRPGARRIGVDGMTAPFSPLLAFHHPDTGRVTVVGINTGADPAALSGTMTSLPELTSLDLTYTSATANLADAGSIPVVNGAFDALIPGDCVFTLSGEPARPAIGVYQSTDRQDVINPANRIGLALGSPFEFIPAVSPLLYYQLDDGSGSRFTIRMLRTGPGLQIFF